MISSPVVSLPPAVTLPSPRRSTRHVLWAAVTFVALLVVPAALYIVSTEFRATRTSHADVQQTREILAQLQTLMLILQDAEAGERGYVITGNREFLEPYFVAQQSLDQQLRSLDQLLTHAEQPRKEAHA